MGRVIKAALAGNPNSGKTTIFNNLTGARHHVANYPGVTVSTEEGEFTFGDTDFILTDLPGTYSLSAYSHEERIARDFLIRQKPDVVINVLDATNIERNLYLTTQLMELGVPLVLVFNMSDMVQELGAAIDIARLSTLLHVPVVETVGHKRRGMDEICRVAIDVAEGRREACGVPIHYGHDIDPAIAAIAAEIEADKTSVPEVSARWMAVKLLENDTLVREKITRPEVLSLADRQRAHLEQLLGDKPEIVIASRRYGFISGACTESLLPSSVEARHIQSDRIDAVLTHRFWGLPIFLALMYVVFSLTFSLGDYPMGWLETFFGWLGGAISGFWPEGSDSLLRSLLVDGIIGGVGGVVSFLPNILLLFLAIAFLEDSGYMSRAAFIMDHLMHKIGLARAEFHPDAHRLRLLCAGDSCDAHARQSPRPDHDDHDHSADELRRTAYCLCADHPGLLPAALAGAGALDDLLSGNPAGRRRGVDFPAYDAEGRIRSDGDGAPAIPDADAARGGDPHMGAELGIPEKGRHSDPGHLHHSVGDEHLSPQAGRGGSISRRGIRRAGEV